MNSARPILVLGIALLLIAGLFIGGVFDPADDDVATLPKDSFEGGTMSAEGNDTASLAGRAEGATRVPAAAPVPRGPITVTMLNHGGHPLPGLPIVLAPAEDFEGVSFDSKTARSKPADANGSATFADVPYDGSYAVGLVTSNLPRTAWAKAQATNANGLRLESLDPPERIRVFAHDVTPVTGPDEIHVREIHGVRYEARAYDAVRDRTVPKIVYRPIHYFLDHTGRECAAPIAAAHAHTSSTRLRRDHPKGYVLWDPEVGGGMLSPLAQSIRIVDLLTPEARLTVSLDDSAHVIDPEKAHAHITVGSRSSTTRLSPADGFGRSAISNVPFNPHTELDAYVTLGRKHYARGTVRLGANPDVPVHLVLAVKEFGDPAVQDHEEMEEYFEEVVEVDNDVEIVGSKLLSGVLMRVLRPDGTPAVGATVQGGGHTAYLEEDGILRLDGVVPGNHRFVVSGAGAPFEVRAVLKPGATTETTARGRLGGRVKVRAVDQDGRPLPGAYAYMGIGDMQYVDVRGTVQRMDKHLDHRGERTFHLMPPGKVRVHINYTGRTMHKDVRVVEGETTDVVIEIDLK